MASCSYFPTLFILSFIAVLVISTVAASGGDFYEGSQLSWMKMPTRSGCRGTMAECMMAGGDEEEFELDSVSSRRILATTRYISYGALQRNSVPCSRRGQSYYNCGPGAPANPYARGCSAITRCRS